MRALDKYKVKLSAQPTTLTHNQTHTHSLKNKYKTKLQTTATRQGHSSSFVSYTVIRCSAERKTDQTMITNVNYNNDNIDDDDDNCEERRYQKLLGRQNSKQQNYFCLLTEAGRLVVEEE